MTGAESAAGQTLLAFAADLYPICRSITGNGVRATLRLVRNRIPLQLHEVPSGTKVFDWEVPLEWNIDDANLYAPDGRAVVRFSDHNLHIVSYSEPIDRRMTLAELAPHLHVHALNPTWIPYRTSYYRRTWGICLPRATLDALEPGDYRAHVDSRLEKGALSYGEFVWPGRSRDEVVFFTHVCHPSLANDNASGIAVATELARWLGEAPRRYTYRVVFAPGTIGSLCWLRRNQSRLSRIRFGLVLGLLGDRGALTYKQTPDGDARIDAIAPFVLQDIDPRSRVIPFDPYGYDERQLCSPGFRLPFGRLTRSVNDGYPEYHSSADNLSLLSGDALAQSLEACRRIVEAIEADRRYVSLCSKGEPRLGKRGLYGAVGGQSPAERERAMLWVLNQSDGSKSLLDIARRSGLGIGGLARAADELVNAKLLRAVRESSARASRTPGAKGPGGQKPPAARKASKRRERS